MSNYAVKELFLTLQGEGAQVGRAAVFIRFSGCNLWSGFERDRERGLGGCSNWCDTQFVGTDGVGGGRFAEASELALAARSLWAGRQGRPLAICTGGEPTLQLDAELVAELRSAGFEVAIETNGTRSLPCTLDWVCVSPKAKAKLQVTAGNELKFVFPQPGLDPLDFEYLDFENFFLQPMDGPARAENTQAAVQFCLDNPRWRLSLQTHKVVGLP